jgi:catechol 2,3-dioxygenase-like lactoylglutathione lyase family enzyme
MKIHHVQLAITQGGEDAARAFWIDIVGFTELDKPEPLRQRGGLWLEGGPAEVHLGIADPFVSATKAHPGFLVEDLGELERRFESCGYETRPDTDFRGLRRFHVDDPFGNRVEFLGRA